MARPFDIFLTALAPMIWGSTYIVTTELLPAGHPLTAALLRALPAGLILLAAVRRLPRGVWWIRTGVLGALNFTVFWSLLFVAAYRLPGGVAATVGGTQALIVIGLARVWLGTPVRPLAVAAAALGLGGVAMLVLTPDAALDPVGVAAALGSAASMGAGTVLSRRWRPPVSNLTFTAWQLTAGGLLLAPPALLLEPPLPPLTAENVAGFAWLGLIGAALTYAIWFRGLARIEPAAITTLGFFSPLTAVLLGWLVLGQSLSFVQAAGVALVLGAVWSSQIAARARPAPSSPSSPQGIAA